jgi:hypothetical protein
VETNFTSGRTYHDMSREDSEREMWNIPTRSYIKPSSNIVATIRLELANSDFDKHNRTAELIKPATQPDLLELPMIDNAQLAVLPVAIRKDWRRCFH